MQTANPTHVQPTSGRGRHAQITCGARGPMADEKETLDPQPRRRVPPPTIDLEATPVSGPSETASASSATASESSDPPPSDPPPGDTSDETSATAPAGPPGPARGRSGIGHVVSGAVGAALAFGIAALAWTQFGA